MGMKARPKRQTDEVLRLRAECVDYRQRWEGAERRLRQVEELRDTLLIKVEKIEADRLLLESQLHESTVQSDKLAKRVAELESEPERVALVARDMRRGCDLAELRRKLDLYEVAAQDGAAEAIRATKILRQLQAESRQLIEQRAGDSNGNEA